MKEGGEEGSEQEKKRMGWGMRRRVGHVGEIGWGVAIHVMAIGFLSFLHHVFGVRAFALVPPFLDIDGIVIRCRSESCRVCRPGPLDSNPFILTRPANRVPGPPKSYPSGVKSPIRTSVSPHPLRHLSFLS